MVLDLNRQFSSWRQDEGMEFPPSVHTTTGFPIPPTSFGLAFGEVRIWRGDENHSLLVEVKLDVVNDFDATGSLKLWFRAGEVTDSILSC